MSTIEQKSPVTPNLPPNKPTNGGERHDPNPNNKKNNKTRNILIGAGATAALIASGVGLMVAGGKGEAQGPEVKPPGNEQVVKSPNEILLDNIANRPAEGTPEYNELFAPYAVPYVEGQPHEEVVLSLEVSMDKMVNSGLSDAPKNERELVNWAIETGKSPADLVNMLELGYYDKGILSQIVAPEILESMMNGRLTQEHRRFVTAVLTDWLKGSNGNISITDYKLESRSDTDFTANPSIVENGTNRDMGSNVISARAVDIDGDNTPDVWHIYSSSLQG